MSETYGLSQRSLKWMVWTFLAEVVMLLVLVPNDWLERVVEKESEMLSAEMGERSAAWIRDKGEHWYDLMFVETGINDEVYRFFIPSASERAASRGLQNLGATSWFPWIEGRAQALSTILRQVLQRAALFESWMVFFLLLVVPFSWDGVMAWKIKQYSFQHASTFVHATGLSAISIMLMVLLIGMFAPAPFPPVVLPILMIVAMVAMNIVARHTQKEV